VAGVAGEDMFVTSVSLMSKMSASSSVEGSRSFSCSKAMNALLALL
jgi:hypothetical protein